MAIFNELSLEAITDEDLFRDDSESVTEEENEEKQEPLQEEETRLDIDSLFDGEDSKSNTNPDTKDTSTKEKDTTSAEASSSPNVYSSCAKAFAEEGVFSLDEDDDIDSITDAEGLIALAKKQVEKQLTETQKRINEALNAGVEPSEIKKYENSISQLESITDEQLSAETTQGKQLREWVIYQEYLSNGLSEERARKLTSQIMKSGSDIDDAKESLNSIINTYKSKYSNLVEEAKKEEQEYQASLQKQAEALKADMVDNEDFAGMKIPANTRKKAYEAVTKLVHTDANGEKLTELQCYQKEHPEEYLKAVGILYTMTNGFKDVSKFVASKVRKEVTKGIKELDNTLNNTARFAGGSLKFSTGASDKESFSIGKGFQLDI